MEPTADSTGRPARVAGEHPAAIPSAPAGKTGESPSGDSVPSEALARASAPARSDPAAHAPPTGATARPAPPPPAPDPASVFEGLRLALAPNRREATLHLHPAELGRIHVRIEVDGGTVRALVRADHEATLQVLQRHLPELRASLEAGGLEPRELDVALFERGAGGRDPQEAHDRRRARRGEGPIAAAAETASPPLRRLTSGLGLDTYA